MEQSKNDNLVKEMPIQLPSGQWFDSAGPFYSTGIHIHIFQFIDFISIH